MSELIKPSVNAIMFDNRRNRCDGSWRVVPSIFHETIMPTNLRDITPKELDNVIYRFSEADIIGIKGGDGTTGWVLNLLAQIEKYPLIFLAGGGSANTLLKGLRTTPSYPLDERFACIFPDSYYQYNHGPSKNNGNLYEAHLYRPPQINYGDHQETAAYLIGTDHLTTSVTAVKETLETWHLNRNIHLTYIVSALTSLFALPNRMEPKNIGNPEQKSMGKIALAAAIAIPILGTFELQKLIPADKMRLLTLTADSEYSLFIKYLAALMISAILPHGADRAIHMGIIGSQDVDEVTFTPAHQYYNCCIDGELVTRANTRVAIVGNKEKKDVDVNVIFQSMPFSVKRGLPKFTIIVPQSQ